MGSDVVCLLLYPILSHVSTFISCNFPVTMNRKVVKDFTFSDGTVLPAGTSLAVASFATHHDEELYANPYEFDGFRFANLREEDGESIKHQMVTTNADYVPFGHGRHSWLVNLSSVVRE